MDKAKKQDVKEPRMHELSYFKDEEGVQKAADVLGIIMEILAKPENLAQKEEKNPFKMFYSFVRNSPKKMMELFAILSEEDPKEYHCDGAEVMTNICILSNDPIMLSFFVSQSQTGDANSSGSASESADKN